MLSLERKFFWEIINLYIHKNEEILDIGCGIKPQTFFIPKSHTCVDPCTEYIDVLKSKNNSDRKWQYWNMTWGQCINKCNECNMHFDSIFLMDIIEHLDKREGVDLLEKTYDLSLDQLFIFTPLGFMTQHHDSDKDAWGLNGAKWQEHKSGWYIEDFYKKDWTLFICHNFHICDNLNNKLAIPIAAIFGIYNIKTKFKKKYRHAYYDFLNIFININIIYVTYLNNFYI